MMNRQDLAEGWVLQDALMSTLQPGRVIQVIVYTKPFNHCC
jgi:hypothetical protein